MLTKEQLVELKERLVEEKEKVAATLAHKNPNVDFGDDVDGFDEETDEAEEFGTVLGVMQVEKEHLLDIDHALEKMREGIYGVCEHCDQPISYEVLIAEPESRLCKACKSLA